MQDASRFTGQPTSKSNRPVNAFGIGDIGQPGAINPNIETRPHRTPLHPATDLSPTKPIDFTTGMANSRARFDWLGRIHAASHDWRKKKTKFRYADGHVETKRLEETVQPMQWGERFHSLIGNTGLGNP